MSAPSQKVREFNLLSEPWIPVLMREGSRQCLGLQSLFKKLRQIRCLEEPSPANLIALHRILIVVAQRALSSEYPRWSEADRACWYTEGFPPEVFERYFERWQDRFWLFDPEHPFMQVAALACDEETRDRVKPWTQISLGNASGSTPTVFDHSCDSTPIGVDAATAIRMLLGYLQFCPGGLVKAIRSADRSGPLANTAAVLPLGENLMETLCLGLYPARGVRSDDEDLPSWERSAIQIEDLRRGITPPTGPSDRYTRFSRAVLLLREGDGTIQRIHFAAGIAMDESADPMAIYRKGKTAPVRVSVSMQRDLWRDLALIMSDASMQVLAIPAKSLEWAAGVHSLCKVPRAKQKILIGGIACDQAKLLRWRMEEADIPTLFLMDSGAAAALTTKIRGAEKIYVRLRTMAIKMLAATMSPTINSDMDLRAQEIVSQWYLSSTFFRSAGAVLPTIMEMICCGRLEEAAYYWNTALVAAAKKLWDLIEISLGRSTASLRAVATYRPHFHRLLDGFFLQELNSPMSQANES